MPLYPTYKPICPANSPIEFAPREPLIDYPQDYLDQSWLNTMVVENQTNKYTYPIQATKAYDRETWTTSSDHCYARPWAWQQDSAFLKPTKSLFTPKNICVKPLFSSGSFSSLDDGDIDVESEVENPTPVYDIENAKVLMRECEKHSSLSRNSIDDENWEERIIKSNWTSSQHRLFNGFVNILNGFYLGKMTYAGFQNEPVLRRSIIDKAVQRVRRLFNTVSYDIKLLQWLHQLLLDNLDQQNLALYLDILQTLRSKIPKILDRILNTPSSAVRMGPLNNENLTPLLKKPWDPVETALQQDKPKKLPSNPIIILMPCSPGGGSKRNNKWLALLSELAQVVTVPTNFGTACTRMTMTNCIDQMFSVTRGRIQEVRENNPGRSIILAGIGAGATLALQVAQVENVFCVVSLGFAMFTAEGRRGEPDDNLLELQCPVLFVIGQCSTTAFQEDMEDLRERMRIETGLIVVGSADNNLILSKKKKREEGVTQSIVDKNIIDEVGEFLSNLLLSPYPPQVRQSPAAVPPDVPPLKKSKLERKRYNSNTSSVESEPPSPTPAPRVPRPGMNRKIGRPAGKSTKCKLEAKWAAQVAKGTTPPTTSSSTIPTTNKPPFPPSVSPPATPSLNDQSHNCTPSSSETASATGSPISSPTDMMVTPTASPTKANERQRITPKSGGGGGGGGNVQGDQGRNVMPGGQLSTLLQGGIKTIPPVQQSKSGSPQIKVLENVTLTTQATAKLITTSTGRTIDLSKLTLGQRSTATSNVVLLPDGKLKSLASSSRQVTMKTSTGTPIVLSLPGKVNQTVKRKFMNPRRLPLNNNKTTPVKRPNFISFPKGMNAPLPPPTNLTTQDIMDLPIIFADDNNELLDPNVPNDLSTSSGGATSAGATETQVEPPPLSLKQEVQLTAPPITKFIPPTSTSKFVLVNKPVSASGLSNFIITPSGAVKRPPIVHQVAKQPTKFTKIILSKKAVEPLLMNRLSGTAAPSTAGQLQTEPLDLESELVATAVLKPKQFSIMAKKEGFDPEEMFVDDDDPDYEPPKNLKM